MARFLIADLGQSMSCEGLTSKEVKCRKPHQCSWCGATIEKGETAQYRAYIFHGDFTWGWEHPECYEAMLTLPNDVALDGWMAGDFMRGSVEYA